MQFMVPNKLFRVAEFAWKLGYSVCKRIKYVYNNLSEKKSTETIG